ncbi:zinc finger SWIM domain-containing protein 8 [Trichonephila clavata]|uniref:Zinc finger SWIM domain-containing protein 8 n=1 Tax=Trichonephila clavata TaxID=2740835 RepID=A0A8X6M5H8_TRICU|nr:zinc finger SWIM domain-containing protein 8 [Trichonephila clavata]
MSVNWGARKCECFKSCKDFLFQMFSSCNKNGINLSELELLGARPEEAGGMFDWDEGDRFSFEDSDRFEEDSLCSWISEPESSCNNWRGWKKQNGNNCGTYHLSHSKNKDIPSGPNSLHRTSEDYSSTLPTASLTQLSQSSAFDGQVTSLVELSAKVVAFHIPFEVVEHVCPPVPEQLQLRIAFWSFPENEEDIRLYSCLANGSADEFQRGEHLYKARAVKELLQIGFHLSATISPPQSLSVKGTCNVAVTFDRCRITSCTCTCTSSASWCSHVVAVCLSRIHQPNHVRLRAPVSESLSRLHRVQLQKFAQYLISELPQQILPTAQRLLDELLSSQQTAINTLGGAPDPTAGASINEQTTWCLDGSTLHDNIRKILIKLCVPSPIVFSDVNYLSSTAPPAAAEWSSLLRPLRGREPEGLWNLLSIVREMFHRSDRNAIPLLEILTEEVLQCDQILSWWFSTKVSLHMGSGGHGGRGSMHSNTHASQHACSSLCDEVVVLWRLAALNPALSPQDRQTLFGQLRCWHMKTLERVWKTRTSSNNATSSIKRADIEVFPGFRPAMEGCLLDWSDYPIPGVTYAEGGGRRWYCPYVYVRTTEPATTTVALANDTDNSSLACFSSRRGRSVDVGQLTGLCPCDKSSDKKSICVLNFHHDQPVDTLEHKSNSNRSSLSSEGFCENEQEALADALAESCSLRPSAHSHQNEGTSSKLVLVNDVWNSQESLQYDSDGAKSSADICKSGFHPSTSTSIMSQNNIEKEKNSEKPVDSQVFAPHCMQKTASVRVSMDCSGEASESQQSSDEYHLYYYDPRARLPSPEHPQPYIEEQWHSVAVKKIEDSLEVLFARAEALHAHGHSHEACMLAIRLAEELLASPPNLSVEPPPTASRGKKVRRFNPASHHVSLLASASLAKVAFLCSVLGENPEHHHLAFRVGLFGLEMTRPPASTKALEVKLANQEQDLVLLLKRLPLLDKEMNIIRERAEQLRDGKLVSRGEALLPLMLASFVFDALTLLNSQNRGNPPLYTKLPGDEQLGFEAAVAALGLKANVSEAEHPLLCEGTRRQRGDLAITLLVTYKDDQEKLAKIMEKLLDKEVHQMYKAPASSVYYSSASNSQQNGNSSFLSADDKNMNDDGASKDADEGDLHEETETGQATNDNRSEHHQSVIRPRSLPSAQNSTAGSSRMRDMRQSHRMHEDNGEHSEGASSPGWEEDYKAWEAKFRCTNFRTTKKHSGGMASIDSSAPETTSSDNSPTVVRRSTWLKQCGPGSDSGSSGESSDSFASSSSEEKAPRCKSREGESLPVMLLNNRLPTSFPSSESNVRSNTPNIKNSRFKGKRAYPSVPNQPSEASAHFMFELAKTVLTKAGGNSSTAVLFTQPSASQNHRGPHRALHMCAFQIGLYALGLHNAVSPNWLSRTYSSHVSWITGEAMEIGSTAINFLIETWEGHLTPPEVASLADRASRGRDPRMVRAAAELALSCLPHAHALNPNEIQRALIQCKEQSSEMLERACLAVESAAKGGGVYPEVLFDVARRWYELYEESLDDHHSNQSERHSNSHNIETVTSIPTPPPTCDHNVVTSHNIHLGQVEGVITTVPSVQVLPPLTCPPVSYTLAYPTAAYGYMPFSHSHVPIHPAYVSTAATYPYPPLANLSYYTPSVANATHIRHPTTGIYPGQVVGTAVTRASVTQSAPVLSMNGHAVVTQPATTAIPPPQQTQIHGPLPQLNQRQMGYLLAAYRVGMLAMETLARRVHDDRPQAKYARNPPYGEDVKWLLGIAKKLGTSYLQDFCICTVNSVASPFILHEIVVEAAQYLARSSTAPLPQPLRSHLLTPLIQKCQQMFTACTHFKMYHITPAEYDEFVSIIRSARTAFQLTPGGIVQFNELLQSLRRTKSCKKDLWQRIANTLANPTI